MGWKLRKITDERMLVLVQHEMVQVLSRCAKAKKKKNMRAHLKKNVCASLRAGLWVCEVCLVRVKFSCRQWWLSFSLNQDIFSIFTTHILIGDLSETAPHSGVRYACWRPYFTTQRRKKKADTGRADIDDEENLRDANRNEEADEDDISVYVNNMWHKLRNISDERIFVLIQN